MNNMSIRECWISILATVFRSLITCIKLVNSATFCMGECTGKLGGGPNNRMSKCVQIYSLCVCALVPSVTVK